VLIDRSPEQKRLAAQQHERLVEVVMLGHSGESAGRHMRGCCAIDAASTAGTVATNGTQMKCHR
jgi:hypothetical protein